MNGSTIPEQRSAVGRLIGFCLNNRLVVALFTLAVILAGILVAPFDWKLGGIRRYPVSVDAIPDIGENQQIVFTQWMGRSPQDVEDQIGYPLSVQLLGLPDVKTVRSLSMFGFSSIYIIFNEKSDFYESRTRILEKLNSLPPDTLPEGVQPTLGPDATALGQVFWYTLEGRDADGNPTGGWGPDELRTIQDWYARYWLLSAEGVAEVASVGGYVREYQIDVDPDAMRAFGVSIDEVYNAVKNANIDVGAKSIEVNRVEYFIRGVGFIDRIGDIENSVIKVGPDHVPVLIRNVADVAMGPAARRGALDKGGADVVGGVVVARYGDNPLEVINHVKEKIAETRDALPKKTLADGTVSQMTVVPFYDRTGLIYETLNTLNEAIILEILITIVVVLVMVMHLRSGLIISSMLPLAVLLCFIAMKAFGTQANIVALSGIVIAIGTIVDMGIVICENVLRHLEQDAPGIPGRQAEYRPPRSVRSRQRRPDRGSDHRCQLPPGFHDDGSGGQALQTAGLYQDLCTDCIHRDCPYGPPDHGLHLFPRQGGGSPPRRTRTAEDSRPYPFVHRTDRHSAEPDVGTAGPGKRNDPQSVVCHPARWRTAWAVQAL